MPVYWHHDSQTVTGDGVYMSDEQQTQEHAVRRPTYDAGVWHMWRSLG